MFLEMKRGREEELKGRFYQVDQFFNDVETFILNGK